MSDAILGKRASIICSVSTLASRPTIFAALPRTMDRSNAKLGVSMASTKQEYFILRNDVPISKTNNFFKNLLNTLNADHVLKGELLVKEVLPQDSSHQSHAIYSLALDRNKKVSCSNSDVIPLSEDDYEWLAAIRKNMDRWQVYIQQDKFEAVKKLQVGDNVWVSLPLGDGTPPHVQGTSCCHATVQYIGPLQDAPGRWVGVELKENRGSSDGSFRDSHYFMCDVDHGAFLPASHILTVSQSSSAPPISTSSTSTLQGPRSTRKKLLVASTKNKTDRDFYLDDPVVVFDKDGKRVPGVAKWAVSGKECGIDCYIIGIETDTLIKKEKVEGHISNMSHLFPHTRDYKKHSYLAISEWSVLKEGEGTPVDARSEAMDVSNPTDVTESVRAVASTVAKNTRSSTAAVLREQARALKESEVKKEEAAKKELADTFGVSPGELDAQREQYKKLEQQQSLNDQKRELYPAVAGSGASGEGQEHVAGNQGGAMIQEYQRSPLANRRHAFDRQGSEDHQRAQPVPPRPLSHNLEVGSTVELEDPQGYGIIRWIGKFSDVAKVIAGVELETRMDGCGDGSWNGEQYFSCRDGHAMFIVLSKLKPDSRFIQQPQGDNPVAIALKGKLRKVTLDDAPAVQDLKMDLFVGRMKGIQGHQNSCYLDATLFAMFGVTDKFDEVIYEVPIDDTAKGVLETMCEEIIFPLRRNGLVCYDPVMKLREALDKLNRVKGLTHAEQDPEEFLNLLFKHVLSLKDPFIKLKRPSGLDTEFFLQLFLVPSEEKKKWTVKEMLHKSLVEQNITFAEAPKRLIIQLPRYGKAYKVFETVYPEMELDISSLCSDYVPSGATCAMCGRNPTYRCRKCGEDDPSFQTGVIHHFCESCVKPAHEHPNRKSHSPEAIEKTSSEPVVLELMSVVCIEKSHYVCFTRLEDSWVFFDSMADRTDDQYNIPEITPCHDVGEALKHIDVVSKKEPADLSPLVRRLVRDASICFYATYGAEMY